MIPDIYSRKSKRDSCRRVRRFPRIRRSLENRACSNYGVSIPRSLPRHGSLYETKVYTGRAAMLAIYGDHPQESITDVLPRKVIKDLRNYSYYTAALVLYGLVRETRAHERTSRTGRKPSVVREYPPVSPACHLPLVSAFVEGTGMRIFSWIDTGRGTGRER